MDGEGETLRVDEASSQPLTNRGGSLVWDSMRWGSSSRVVLAAQSTCEFGTG